MKGFFVMLSAAILAYFVFVEFELYRLAPLLESSVADTAAQMNSVSLPAPETAAPAREYPEGDSRSRLRLWPGDEVKEYIPSMGAWDVYSPSLGGTFIYFPVERPAWPLPVGSFTVSDVSSQSWPIELGNLPAYQFTCLYAPAGTPIRSPLTGHGASVTEMTAFSGDRFVVVEDKYTLVVLAQAGDFSGVSGTTSAFLLDDYLLGYTDGGCLQAAVIEQYTTPPTEAYSKWYETPSPFDAFAPVSLSASGTAVAFGSTAQPALPDRRLPWPFAVTSPVQSYEGTLDKSATMLRAGRIVCLPVQPGTAVSFPAPTYSFQFTREGDMYWLHLYYNEYLVIMKGVDPLASSPALGDAGYHGVVGYVSNSVDCVKVGVWQNGDNGLTYPVDPLDVFQ